MSKKYLFLCGLAIGTADLLPGISGGTIALLLGLYGPILAVLQQVPSVCGARLRQGQWRSAWQAIPWHFIAPLGAGIGVAILALARVIAHILAQPSLCQLLYASFAGLVLASAWMLLQRLQQWRGSYVALMAGAALVAYLATSGLDRQPGPYTVTLAPAQVPLQAVSLANYQADSRALTGLSMPALAALYTKGVIDDQTIVNGADIQPQPVGPWLQTWQQERPYFDTWIFLCGSLAICATLLPGVSGSYCLNVLGVYGSVIIALSDVSGGLMHGYLAWEPLRWLGTLLLGVIVGAMAFARLLGWTLRRYHDATMTAMVGLMLGTLHTLWPFRSSAYVLDPFRWDQGPQLWLQGSVWPDVATASFWVALLCASGAFIAVLSFEYYTTQRSCRQSSTATVFSSTSRVQ